MVIYGVTVNVINNSISPMAKRALKWDELDNGNFIVSDEGESADQYFSTFDVKGSKTAIDSLFDVFGAYREDMSITHDDGERIFGPDIVSDLVTITKYPDQARDGYGYWVLEGIEMRALSLTFDSPFPNLDLMKLKETRYTASTGFRINKSFSIDGTAVYCDRNVAQGIFKARMRSTNSNYQVIRSHILRNIRGTVISFPDIQGITYPWGSRGPSTGGDCRIKKLENEKRVDLDWEYDIEFVREQ